MDEIFVARAEDFADKARRLVAHGDVEIGVFRIDDSFVAWRNECAHQGGPVCQGRIFPKVEEQLTQERTVAGLRYVPETMHVVCPWHGYEYDLRTGANSGQPRLRLRKVDVVVRDGRVYVRV